MTLAEFEAEKARRAHAVEVTQRWQKAHPEWRERRNDARRKKSADFSLAKAEFDRKAKAAQEGNLSVYDPSMEGAL